MKSIKDTLTLCPKCNIRFYSYEAVGRYPAMSRRDNATMICPECGLDEALEDFTIKGDQE